MQYNNKILETLNKWNDSIEGWFWNDDKQEAVEGSLTTYTNSINEDSLSYMNDGRDWYKNFSLTNPNNKRLISTVEDAVAWSLKHPDTVVKTVWGDLHNAKDLSSKYYDETSVITGVNNDGSMIWTPLTEIECV